MGDVVEGLREVFLLARQLPLAIGDNSLRSIMEGLGRGGAAATRLFHQRKGVLGITGSCHTFGFLNYLLVVSACMTRVTCRRKLMCAVVFHLRARECGRESSLSVFSDQDL